VAITINAVNDAPLASGSSTLSPVNEDTASPPGDTVSNLFSARFSDITDTVSGGSSANSLLGVVLTANAATSAQGTWQWNNAGTWTDISTSLTDSAGLFLTAATSLRFLPAANFNGTPGALSARLADSSISAPSNGSTLNVSNANNGGTTAYSLATVALGTSITAVNDAPLATGWVSANSLQPSTTSVLTLSGAVTLRGIATDGNFLYVNDGGINIKVYRMDGSFVSSRAVANLPSDRNQMAFAKG
jgi:hypothetical protein